MARAFRFAPPDPRPDLVMRTRLLRSLAGRWQHRVTSLTGGPGLGKTTVLAQAIVENRLAPRGEDLWVGVEPADAHADSLARVVAVAVERRGRRDVDLHDVASQQAPADPETVADAVWRHAPTEECLVLDDVHLLERGSTGAAWLEALVAALPANGHVVLASRAEPAVRLGRYGTSGEVLRLVEDDLRFDADECTGFAHSRGIDPSWLDVTGGWPAMAELIATVDQHHTGAYLWEEVIEPLGTGRRHVLAVLSDLGGGDDALVSAAMGMPVDLAEVLDGVPLVARRADGWHVPHGLWSTAPGLALDPTERDGVRRRAADHLLSRRLYDDAFGLLEEAELWDAAPRVLRAACLAPDRLVAPQLGRWLSRIPDDVRDTVAGDLAVGIHAWLRDPGHAVEPLRRAATRAREAGDVDAEVTALAQLGNEAWWRWDPAVLAELAVRVSELAATGNPRARQLATVGRVIAADFLGDDRKLLDQLGRIDPEDADPAWLALSIWLSGMARLNLGDLDGMRHVVEHYGRVTDPAQRYVLATVDNLVTWFQGDVDASIARIEPLIHQAYKAGNTPTTVVGLTMATIGYALVGDAGRARRRLDDARAMLPPTLGARSSSASPSSSSSSSSPQMLLAKAMVQLAEGDEEASAATFRRAVADHPIDRGASRHFWRNVLPHTYVLVPESREHWDAQPLHGPQATARDLARAVLAAREGQATGSGAALASLDLPPPGVVRALLGHHLIAELAVGLAQAGRPEARTLLLAAGPAAREVVRRRAGGTTATAPRRAKAARALLAAVPAPPPEPTYVSVLGPVVLRRGGPGGEPVTDPDLRRRRVQELLAFLVVHRRTTRTKIAGALWPDLDERAAGNNLGVTINHLLRVLEPGRDQGEPSYLLRVDGQAVQLVTDELLALDVDVFDEHVAAAARAEAEGTPSVALEHHLAAVALYRDTLHLDLPDAEWLDLERERYRGRFLAAAVRAGQLLAARGDIDKAQTVVYRALTSDPWSEEAYAVLVGAALARSDRSGARRLLQRCDDALADLGVGPSDATQQLRRRVELA